ncbi:hypothetical protein JRO89_XS14G0087200 [Xanthoceras sorbifolium]|uniref:Uncharacterized protein n=1 Tax=Xanthoceras sorbifolium TaxID=99658 RepID=A0ABQ8H4J1_9ROSI|nr:hypothetical protein JRO89_XS14G0087200 [Xanthoceras sorbifolium]
MDNPEEEEEWMKIGNLREKCKEERSGTVELLECLEREAIMGDDEGKEPTDYNRRAHIFDKSSKFETQNPSSSSQLSEESSVSDLRVSHGGPVPAFSSSSPSTEKKLIGDGKLLQPMHQISSAPPSKEAAASATSNSSNTSLSIQLFSYGVGTFKDSHMLRTLSSAHLRSASAFGSRCSALPASAALELISCGLRCTS